MPSDNTELAATLDRIAPPPGQIVVLVLPARMPVAGLGDISPLRARRIACEIRNGNRHG